MKSGISFLYGEICGSKFTIAYPDDLLVKQHKFNLLIHLHGCRPVGIPLVADLNVQTYEKLLLNDKKFGTSDGNTKWIVAMPSYREEGPIIEDAILDVINLRNHIVQVFGGTSFLGICIAEGKYQMILSTQDYLNNFKGESMGGCIATLISERHGDLFHGCIATCPALYSTEKNQSQDDVLKRFSFVPRIPLLFLVNECEPAAIDFYMQKVDEKMKEMASTNPDDVIIKPAYWIVERDGHCNVNNEELNRALLAVITWIDKGVCDPMTDSFALIPEPVKSTSKIYHNNNNNIATRLSCTIIHIDVYGDLFLSVTQEEMNEKMRIFSGKKFMVGFGESDTRYEVYYGSSFCSYNPSVPEGRFMAWDEAGGRIVLCINYSYIRAKNNAAKIANVKVGDEVHIEPMPIPTKPNKHTSSSISDMIKKLSG